jgi:hypothetical protein
MLSVFELIPQRTMKPAMQTMKPARIFPLLLIALIAFIAPRVASAQPYDSIWVTNDCGSDPGFDWGFLNNHPEFVNQFLLIITPASVEAGFSFNATGEDGADQKLWADSVTVTGDTANYYPLFNGVGDATGTKDSAHFFLLGGPGGIQFPDSLFGKEVTIEWISLAGGQYVNSGFIYLIPSSYQGQCTFDSVSGSATTAGCDLDFDFHVFNHNGPEVAINQMQFQIEGSATASIEPSGMQAPPGWTADSASQYIAYFSTSCGSSDQIDYGSSLSGFIVPVRASASATQFTWEWAAGSCGILIDADTVSVDATPPSCSQTTTVADSVTILNAGECNFQINVKNYHNGNNADTVSPLTSYTFVITSPANATWTLPIDFPTQVQSGTWQYSISDSGPDSGKILNFHEVAKWMPNYGQSAGTIWTWRPSIDNPDTGKSILVQWSDSNTTTFLSSGTDTTSCKEGKSDTAWVETGSDCNYTLIVGNTHTNPSSSINAIAMTIPAASGSFPSSCFTSSNHWTPSVPGSSARFTNTSGASGYLKTGSFDTIHFCIDPSQPNSPWDLTWTTIDSNNGNLFSNVISVPGCAPPLVCDSIRHIMNPADCSDSIVVLNLRQGGAEVDSVIVAPSPGWGIVKVDTPLYWQAYFYPDGSVHFTATSHAITPGLSLAFHVWYNNPDPNSFTVQVTTNSNGGTACSNTQTVQCPVNGVSPSSTPQTLEVSVVPNPMNQQADITLSTGTFDRIQMTLMDVLGRTAKTVLDGTIAAGDHDYTLDVSQLPPGTYYLRIVTSGATLTKKLVVEH